MGWDEGDNSGDSGECPGYGVVHGDVEKGMAGAEVKAA